MTLSGLSLRDLEYLVAVAELRHFGQAAERCGVSQPALSMQIRKLEETLGLALFERGPKTVLVTAKGEVILTQARRVLLEARRLMALAQELDAPLSGPLTVGAIETLGPYLFPHMLRPLRRAFPRLELVLHEGRTYQLVEALRHGALDLVFLSLPVADPQIATAPLFFEPFVLAQPADRPVAADGAARIAELPRDGLLLLEDGHCLRDQALEVCGTLGLGGKRHSTSLETLRQMIAAGAGYSLFPRLATLGEASVGGLVSYAGFDGTPPGRMVGLAWRHSDPRAEQFESLRHILLDHPPPGTRVTEEGGKTEDSDRGSRHRVPAEND
jgi:LysR family hydrogen peroxide-inducible transcriptional activator